MGVKSSKIRINGGKEEMSYLRLGKAVVYQMLGPSPQGTCQLTGSWGIRYTILLAALGFFFDVPVSFLSKVTRHSELAKVIYC